MLTILDLVVNINGAGGGGGTHKTYSTNSLYIWASLSLFTLESGGRAAYMETHP